MLMQPDVKVFIATFATDMRKSFDGLAILVKQDLKKEVFSGDLFVFFNRKRDRIKVLYWDRNGYCVWAKRLEQGVYRLPKVQGNVISMRTNELNLLLEGIDLTSKQRLVSL